MIDLRWDVETSAPRAPASEPSGAGDVARSIESLERLHALLRAFDQVAVRCGHQR